MRALYFPGISSLLVPGFRVWDHSHLQTWNCLPLCGALSFFSVVLHLLPNDHTRSRSFSPTPPSPQCHITSLSCWSQVKVVLLRMHRIHTVTSSDRMSPVLPPIKPRHPHAATQLSPPACVVSRARLAPIRSTSLTMLQHGSALEARLDVTVLSFYFGRFLPVFVSQVSSPSSSSL